MSNPSLEHSPTVPKTDATDALLHRGQLALTALEYQEQAARFRAAASSLRSAMMLAEQGHCDALQRWLDENASSDLSLQDLRMLRGMTAHAWPVEESSAHSDAHIELTRAELQTYELVYPRIRIDTEHVHLENDERGLEKWHSCPSVGLTRDHSEEDRPEPSKQASVPSSEQVRDDDSNSLSVEMASPAQATAKSRISTPMASMGALDIDDAAPVESETLESERHFQAKHLVDSPQEMRRLDSAPDFVKHSSTHRTPVKEVMESALSTELASISMESSETHELRRPWWRAPHVYSSLIVHAVLVFGMSFFYIVSSKPMEKLGVVAALYEADNVLIETPMEIESESEQLASEAAMESLSQMDFAHAASDLSMPSLDVSQVESGTAGAMPASQSGGITSLVSNVVGGGIGTTGGGGKSTTGGSMFAQGADFFGVKAAGNTFVYVVDSSPSMRRDGAFDAARQELMRSLSSMKPKQRYFVQFFGKEIDPLTFENGKAEKYPVYATPENLRRTLQWMERIQIQRDGFPPVRAIEEAIAMQPDAIFLLFDGDTSVDVAAALKRINRNRDILSDGGPKVPIHVVHFFNRDFELQMKKVAEENAGTYRFVPRPEKPRGKK